mgnify:FL=1
MPITGLITADAVATSGNATKSMSQPSNFEPFAQLDLSDVVARVEEEHSDWTPERLETAEQEYRKWLFLCSVAPKGTPLGMGATPGSMDVDEIWHNHILFTRKYMRDCRKLCGRFVHHTPATKADKESGDRSRFADTQRLYLANFGERHPTWFHGLKAGECDGGPDECYSEPCRTDPSSCYNDPNYDCTAD